MANDPLVLLHEAVTREDCAAVQSCMDTLFLNSHEEVKKLWSSSSTAAASLQRVAQSAVKSTELTHAQVVWVAGGGWMKGLAQRVVWGG